MRKLTTTLLAATAITILTIGPLATPSGATTAATWTVKPGGNFSASGNRALVFKDTKNGFQLGCPSSSMSGLFKSGSGLAGTKIANVPAVKFNQCGPPPVFTGPITNGTVTYYLNAQSYDAAQGTTTVTITHIHGKLVAPGCIATIDGTGANADNGTVTGDYANSTGKLQTMTHQSNLHFYDVTGCYGLFSSGDPVTLIATFTMSPVQTITSP